MKKIVKSLILLLIPLSLTGQVAPVSNQYVLNPFIINPAYAGNRGALNIAAFYRRQWTGIVGAPATMSLAMDAPYLDSKLGLGFILTNDKVGVTKETHFLTNYSYKIAIGGGTLSLGLGAGLITTNTTWSDLVVLDPGDEQYLSDSRVFVVPDFSFGAFYSGKSYFIGLSVPKLIGYQFNLVKDKYNLNFSPGKYSYLVNAGYVIKLSQTVNLLPSTLITLASGEKFLFDLNACVSLNDRIWAGLSYKNTRTLSGLFQIALNNQFHIAYTYDFDMGKLSSYSNGSHEIMIRYEFRYKVNAISPLNF
jgi:type IX secretion system PorP/SprF family membrane protein